MAESPDITADSSEAADLREARSIRYVLGLRLALLSSGRWAIFYGGEIEIRASLDSAWLRSCGEDERKLRERADMDYYIQQERLAEAASPEEADGPQETDRSLEELGL